MDRYATITPIAQLNEGDVIWTYGMRVQLSHRTQDEVGLIRFHGRILNAADVDAAYVTPAARTSSDCDCQPGEHWTVQGFGHRLFDLEV